MTRSLTIYRYTSFDRSQTMKQAEVVFMEDFNFTFNKADYETDFMVNSPHLSILLLLLY